MRPAVFYGGVAKLPYASLEILALLTLGAVLLVLGDAPAYERSALEREHHAVSDIHTHLAAEHGGRLSQKLCRVFHAAYHDEEFYLVPAVRGKLAEKRREINYIDSRILCAENGSKRLELAPFAVYRGDYLPLAAPEMRKIGDFINESSLAFLFSTNIFLIISGNADAENIFLPSAATLSLPSCASTVG